MADVSVRGDQLDLDVRWVHGARNDDPADVEAAGPPLQVNAIAEHAYVIRQNKTLHYEAPFRYLLLGERRALLLDTGAPPRTAPGSRCAALSTRSSTRT